MTRVLRYRPLFSVEIGHDYYLSEDLELYGGDTQRRNRILQNQRKNYDVARLFEISQTPDCISAFNDLKLIFKTSIFGFFVGIQVVPRSSDDENLGFKPAIEIDKSLKLRFLLKIKDLNFPNYSNLKLKKESEISGPQIYYFSNRNNNVVDESPTVKKLYLTKSIAPFSKEKNYEAGQLVVRDAGLLESIQDVKSGSDFESSDWRNIYLDQDPFPQFVSEDDRLSVRPKVFKHKVITDLEIHHKLSIVLYDKDAQVLKRFHFEVNLPDRLTECYLDLRDYPSGIYTIEVEREDGSLLNDLKLRFYLDDLVFNERPIALIECSYEPNDDLGEYEWFDKNSENKLLGPTYHIRWKSRPTYWRFYFGEPPNFSSTLVEALPPPDDKILQTKMPLALSQMTRSIEISYDGNTVPGLLPNPNTARIIPKNGKLFSEIDMGGLLK